MSKSSEHLERLISLYLDDEGTSAERRELRTTLRSDAAARTVFEEYEWLDRETGLALRRALGRSAYSDRSIPLWQKIGRGCAIAAAAGLATMVWLGPLKDHENNTGGGNSSRAGQTGSWFLPAQPREAPRGDTLEIPAAGQERPHVRVRSTDRNWIIVPGQRDGEFFLIEVDRVQTHVVRLQQDF